MGSIRDIMGTETQESNKAEENLVLYSKPSLQISWF